MQIDKQTKKTGKARRRLNIAVIVLFTRPLPRVVTDCVNNVLPLVVVVEVNNFFTRLSGSIGVEEEEPPNGGR